MARARAIVPEARKGLDEFKTEVAGSLGVQFTDYNGDLTAKQCGSVGGEMVKRMISTYEKTNWGR